MKRRDYYNNMNNTDSNKKPTGKIEGNQQKKEKNPENNQKGSSNNNYSAIVKSYLNKYNWSYCMEIFWDFKDTAIALIRNLVSNNQLDEAYSIIHYMDYRIPFNIFPQLEKAYRNNRLNKLDNYL